ncbi:MAG TPA: RNA-binding protein [Flavobacterium sp.]|nr:RNA-binding protein [Flavobacterium sp.]
MNIFIGNLNFQTTEEQLQDVFAPFGEVASVKIVTDKFTGRSRGFAFVEMPDQTEAEKAVEELHDYVLNNRNMVVNEAKPKTEDNRFNNRSRY